MVQIVGVKNSDNLNIILFLELHLAITTDCLEVLYLGGPDAKSLGFRF